MLYSHSFNISLIMLCMVTTLIIMCISSAPALSLGMVGALSIVRFRTAVEDPMDTVVYVLGDLRWHHPVGANFILFSIIGTLVIAVVLLLLSFTGHNAGHNYLLVVHYDDRYTKEVTGAINKMISRYKLKSKTATRNGIEMTLELRLQGNRCQPGGQSAQRPRRAGRNACRLPKRDRLNLFRPFRHPLSGVLPRNGCFYLHSFCAS